MMEWLIEQTADGSPTLFVPGLDEHYHSIKGAWSESRHVYIDMGMKCCPKDRVRILEIGFGTGLNAYLTLLEATRTGKKIHYTGIEKFPLDRGIPEEMNYTDDPLFGEMHQAEWESDVEISPGFTLRKLKTDFTTCKPPDTPLFDVVYFDAFAPEKQPEMWDAELFDNLYASMEKGGILTTYCAKGIIRRTLQRAGFRVERLAGPPGGKREILRAIKPDNHE